MPQTILVPGASGFIGAHVVNAFLERSYNVRGTVRSQVAADKASKTHSKYLGQFSTVIVPDIAAERALDEVVKGVDGVIHVASPFILGATDYEKDLFRPAIIGTESVLSAVHRNNPTVRRIVITSSFAANLDPAQGMRPGYAYSERDWNPVTTEVASKSDAVVAYLASKTLAERAAWDFVEREKPNFSVTTLTPPMVYDPIIHDVESLSSLNTSSSDTYRLINSSEKEVPDTSFWAFADVRDLAVAHVLAYEKQAAGGQRYMIASSNYSYQQICDIIRDKFPTLQDLTPKGDTGAPLPPVYTVDTPKAVGELGLTFHSLEETVVDTVTSFLALGEKLGRN